MARYRLTEPAQQDLLELAEFIATDNVQAARRMVDRLESAMLSLAWMPETGHRREDLTHDETIRFWSVGGYLIVFRVSTRPLEVIRIIHGARDVESELNDRGELG